MKILVIAPAWVGDMVMAHTLVSLLTRSGDAHIDMVAPPATAPLADRMPGVAKCFTLDTAHGELGIGKRRRLAAELAKERYDQAIVLPNSFKSALLPFWARVPKRTGWHGEARFGLLNDRRQLDPGRYPLMIERFMALGLPEGAPLPRPYPEPRLTADPERARVLLQEFDLSGSGVTVLCPGAEYGPAKRWPAAHYAAIARHEVAAGRQVWLLGSPGDAAACREIEAEVRADVVNLAGRTTLLDALDLVALADRVVCNDSGLMHVACALDRPVVAVFGSTSPDFTPPLGHRARVVTNPVPCSPCFERECPLGHMDCLVKLEPGRVLEVL